MIQFQVDLIMSVLQRVCYRGIPFVTTGRNPYNNNLHFFEHLPHPKQLSNTVYKLIHLNVADNPTKEALLLLRCYKRDPEVQNYQSHTQSVGQ